MMCSWCSLSSAEDVKLRRAGRIALGNRQGESQGRRVVVVVLQDEPPFQLFPEQQRCHQLPIASLLVLALVGRS